MTDMNYADLLILFDDEERKHIQRSAVDGLTRMAITDRDAVLKVEFADTCMRLTTESGEVFCASFEVVKAAAERNPRYGDTPNA